MSIELDIEAVLSATGDPPGRLLGRSRQGRPIYGFCFGHGPHRVSLIAGCHADEPVGPAMLDLLAAFLAAQPASSHLLRQLRWLLVPHVNPDGEARNAAWTRVPDPAIGALPRAYDPALYLRHVVREAPGDDIEFGFPRDGGDVGARPENRAVAAFLAEGAPLLLHASFHGMAWAAGPWFLLESAWAERTGEMRRRLRRRVREMGYRLHDVDRGGEKGFFRIDEGFTTRPDSRAMAAHFEALGDPATAALFRPSSMELARSLGGDPLTLVSEMPLFLLPAKRFTAGRLVSPEIVDRLRRRAATDLESARRDARAAGLQAMPIEDQMRLQLAFLSEGLRASLAAVG